MKTSYSKTLKTDAVEVFHGKRFSDDIILKPNRKSSFIVMALFHINLLLQHRHLKPVFPRV